MKYFLITGGVRDEYSDWKVVAMEPEDKATLAIEAVKFAKEVAAQLNLKGETFHSFHEVTEEWALHHCRTAPKVPVLTKAVPTSTKKPEPSDSKKSA